MNSIIRVDVILPTKSVCLLTNSSIYIHKLYIFMLEISEQFTIFLLRKDCATSKFVDFSKGERGSKNVELALFSQGQNVSNPFPSLYAIYFLFLDPCEKDIGIKIWFFILVSHHECL